VQLLPRIGPATLPRGFGVNMSGKPSQFGIDEEELGPALEGMKALANVAFRGFHIYSGTQCLDAGSVAQNFEIFIGLFARFAEAHDLAPAKLIFGSGFGIPYHDGQQPLDLGAVAESVNPMIDALRENPRLARADCLLEMGRYLVGESGYYLTRVLRVKDSRGKRILICDGGMHQHLAAAGLMGSVLHRNYLMVNASRDDQARQGKYDLVGSLCTTIDRLGRDLPLPETSAGDLIAIRSSGAYGLTSSPLHFISHPLPRELLVETVAGQREVHDVSDRGVPRLARA
jgi:diaminopimelate decarboxylase